MDEQGFNYFENSRYIDTRIQRKTLILDVDIGTDIDISKTLEEPISINKESEIYLDSFTTYGALQNDATVNTNMGFLLDIKEFNIKTISTNQIQNRKIRYGIIRINSIILLRYINLYIIIYVDRKI